jgi:lipopolysaccharide transport system permease protein
LLAPGQREVLATLDVSIPTRIYSRSRKSLIARFRELLQYHELVYSLTQREVKVRYKNSALGFLWSLLNPLGMMVVFTIVFTVMMPNNHVQNFPIFLLSGLLPWNFFSAGVMVSIHIIVSNANLVKKVYFPREVLPIAGVFASLVNFLLALVVFFGVLFLIQWNISPWIWMLPLVIFMQTCFILGVAFVLSALNVFYRDTMMVMDVVMLAWFFMTPVFYPIAILPSSYEVLGITLDIRRMMYILNPMASLIATYRDLLYGGVYTRLDFFLRTAATCLIVLVVGYWFFCRYSGRFGEEV